MIFKGWGTSLAWWANIKYPNDTKNRLSELLFSDNLLKCESSIVFHIRNCESVFSV